MFYFGKSQNKKGEIVDQAVCKYCQSALSAKSNGGTGHLRRHMETCQTKHAPQDLTQTQLSQYGSGPSGITSFIYSQQTMREGLARYIAAAEQPLTFSEDERLINFLQRYVQPQLKKVPRNTLKRDLTKIFHDMKKILINTFINFNGVISISSDCWIAGMTHINHYLEKIKAAILYIRAPSRRQQFLETMKIFGLKRRKFNLDMKVRWNSTYLMLLSCQNYSEAISSFYNERMNDEDYHITDYDWNVFYDATLACSTVYEPTSCRVLMHLYNISYTFKTFRENIMFKNICDTMEEKFQKYWKDIPHLFIFAAVLDPTIKEVGAKLLVEGISENLQTRLDTIMSSMHELFNFYRNKFGSSSTYSNVQQASTSYKNPAHLLLLKDLATPSQLQNFDILEFWMGKTFFFLILSIMARDLLTPPASTVASESAFSTGGRILDEHRSRLSSETLDSLLCLKDWEDAERRVQQDWQNDLIKQIESLNVDQDEVDPDYAKY
ncbi:hypothetical protein CUMW_147530 [Citrus unshiu]|nr:hypothetical protein CUMW_147530 [Citrus unshiu]